MSVTPLADRTPFERGNGNQTTTWAECIAFYERLAERFPGVLRWWRIGTSDNGLPMHAGLVTADGVFDRDTLREQGRPVFFNNNGIHPGEPDGIDASMLLVRVLHTTEGKEKHRRPPHCFPPALPCRIKRHGQWKLPPFPFSFYFLTGPEIEGGRGGRCS